MASSMKFCLTMSVLICPPKAVATATRQGWAMLAGVVTPVLSRGYCGLNSKNHFTPLEARR
jgi:hypothetical protein